MSSYRSEGGNISIDRLLIDHKAFPFVEKTNIPRTVKETRYEVYTTTSSYPKSTVAATPGAQYVFDFDVKATSDGTLYDLNNSYFRLNLSIPDSAVGAAQNWSLAQFALNNIVTDCYVYFNSALVSEPHTNTYPYSAFTKDILLMNRPQLASSGFDEQGGTGLDIHCDEDAVMSGNFLANAGNEFNVKTSITSAANYTKMLVGTDPTAAAYGGNKIQMKLNLKDGVWMTSDYFPSTIKIAIRLILNLDNLIQYVLANVADRPIITLNKIDFMMKRVFLEEDSREAFNKASIMKPLTYSFPYSRVETFQILRGSTNVKINQLFQGARYDPEMLVIFGVGTIVDASFPLVACGRANRFFINTDHTGIIIKDAFVNFKGKRYPSATNEYGYIGGDVTTYQEYKKNCLNDEECYLPYANWVTHYSPYVISLRDDGSKMWNLKENEGLGQGLDLYIEYVDPGALRVPMDITLYIVALSNARLEIENKQVTRFGYTN